MTLAIKGKKKDLLSIIKEMEEKDFDIRDRNELGYRRCNPITIVMYQSKRVCVYEHVKAEEVGVAPHVKVFNANLNNHRQAFIRACEKMRGDKAYV